MPPFGGELGTAEALQAMTIGFITLAIFFYAETRTDNNPALRIIVAGLSFYFFTLAEVAILQVCFIGFTLYNLFKMIRG